MIKPVLFLTNMYPSKRRPYYGVFVEESVQGLRSHGANVEVVSVPAIKNKLIAYAFFYFKAVVSLLFNPNSIVYVHYVSHSYIPVLITAFLKKRMKVVVHFHGSDAFPEKDESGMRVFLKQLVCKLACKQADLVVVPSDYFKLLITNRFKPKSEVFVSPSGGVNKSVFGLGKVPLQNRKTISFCGRLIPQKGALVAFDVIEKALCATSGWDSFYIGSGPCEGEIVKLSDSSKVRDRISLSGLVSRPELVEIFQQTSVFLFPSMRKAESLGLVVVEAIFCGAIPVCLQNGAVKEMIPSSLWGELIADNELEYTRKVISLINRGPDYRANLSATLINYVSQKFSADIVSRVLYQKFCELGV